MTIADQAEEIGDLLFAVVNLARHLKIDAEQALRAANNKFQHRFHAMEIKCDMENIDFTSLSLNEMELLWQYAKSQQS